MKPAPLPIQHSPLDVFVEWLKLFKDNRQNTIGFGAELGISKQWKEIGEDVAMMIDENVSIGLRSKWVRRVALPIYFAHKRLHLDIGTEQEKGLAALEILKQCTDENLRNRCAEWIGRVCIVQ